MKTEIITTPEAFEALQPEWNDLLSRMTFPEIFYGWEWNWLYYRYFRQDSPLYLVSVREAGRLVGLAPLCVNRRRALGRHVRRLETVVGNMADYRNLLVDGTRNRWRIVQAIFEALAERRADWDVIEIRQLPSQDSTMSQLWSLISQCRDMRYGLRVQSKTSRLFYRNYESKMIAKEINRVRHKRERLIKERGLECRVGEAGGDDFWRAYLPMHQARWPTSPLHQANGRQFFADLRCRLAARGEIECSWAKVDGKMAAMHFGFRDKRKIYHYMPAMADQFRQERVGNVLNLAMIEHYAPTHQEFDFLRGDESYKMWWTDDVAVNYRLRVYHRSSISAFADGFLPVTKEYLSALAVPGYVASQIRHLLRGKHDGR